MNADAKLLDLLDRGLFCDRPGSQLEILQSGSNFRPWSDGWTMGTVGTFSINRSGA